MRAIGKYVILQKEKTEESTGFTVVNPDENVVNRGVIVSLGCSVMGTGQLKTGLTAIYLTDKALEIETNVVAVHRDFIIAVGEDEGE